MAEKIGLEAVFETSKFSQAMKAYFENIKTAEDVTDNLADALTRLGYDFSDLEGNVGRMAQRMRASTPENLKFAQSYERIVKEFKDGKITSQQAADQLDKLQREMKETGDASNKAQGGVKLFWTELNSMIGVAKQVISTLGQAAQEVYNFGKAGAELLWIEEKFDRLSIAIGTTGDALREDLDDAIGGFVSKSDQMALAADVIGLGLVKTGDQAVRLSSVVANLGADMNEVVLTLTNRTTRRFDQIGIAVDGFDQKLKALEAQGYSTEDAFTEAFLRQGEEQIKKVGSVADSTYGSFLKLEAATKDWANTLKQEAATSMAPYMSHLAKIFMLKNMLNEAVDKGVISQSESNLIYTKANWTLEETEKAIIRLDEAMEAWNHRFSETYGITDENAARQADYNNRIAEGIPIVEDATESQEALTEAEKLLEEQTKKAREEQEKLAAATQAAKDAANAARIAFYDLAAQLSEGIDDSTAYNMQVARLGELLTSGKIDIDEYDAAVVSLGKSTGNLTDQGIAGAEAWDIFNQLVGLGIVDMEQYDLAFQAMSKTAGDGVVTMKEVIGAIDGVGAAADNSSTAYGTAADRMNAIELGEAIAEAGGLANYLNQISSIPANQKKVIDVYTTNYIRTVALSSREQQYGFGDWSERASGGDVSAGTPYIVGEQRPEVFVPGSDGYIFPSVQAFQNALARAGGSTVNNNTSNFNMNIGSMNANQSTVERSFAMMQLLAR